MGNKSSYPRRSLADGAEVVIHGVVYDVSEFRHPGGSILRQQLNPVGAKFPADATIAFEQMHGQSKKPRQELSNLKRLGKTRQLTKDERDLIAQHRPYDDRLNKKYFELTRKMKEQGLFDYTIRHFIWRQVELIALIVFGAWCAIAPGQWAGWWTGALSIGVAMQRAGWWQHECNHGSVSKYETLNWIVGSFWFGFAEAGSAAWWRRAHNRHHADPQRHGADVDMDILPLASDSITAKHGNPSFLRLQAWLYQFAIWALVHFWQLWLHPMSIIKNHSYLDAFFLVLHWVCWIAAFVPTLGWVNAMLLHAAASVVEATLLFTNFALSHTAMPFLPNYLREHWIERALRRTIDIHSHSRYIGAFGPIVDVCVDWIMGYLNYQTLHHLWPLMPQWRQADPRAHAAVRELAAEVPELDLAYNVTSYWQAMYDMYSNLSSIAIDHGANVKPDAEHPTAPSWVRGVARPAPIPTDNQNQLAA